MLEMAHIQSYFGIEREFDRYYSKLKMQMNGSPNHTVWSNPDPSVPFETAHLSGVNDLTSLEYLSNVHNSIKTTYKTN
jgi:hypothetical protein